MATGASVQLNWYGPKVKAKFDDIAKKKMTAAAIMVVNHAKMLLSIPYPPPSTPGESPHRRIGRLRASITWEMHGRIARVGTNVKYGRILELGSSKMAARPWLRRALIEKTPQIKALFRK